MIQIHLPYLIDFVATLDRLSGVTENRTVGNVYGLAYLAKQQLDTIYGISLYAPALRSSRQLAVGLTAHLDTLMKRPFNETVTYVDQLTIQSSRDQFRTAFMAELGILPSFFVTQKAGFDTAMLLERGDTLFPQSLTRKVPETLADVSSSARALAFDLGTAAGFHLFRVLEAVLRRYYAHVAGGTAAPKVRTIGTYVAALERLRCGDPQVLATLKQIKDLHRNPLVHPEAVISTDQAVSLFGIIRSAIEAMLISLPEVSADVMVTDIAKAFGAT